jgi:serine protease Do
LRLVDQDDIMRCAGGRWRIGAAIAIALSFFAPLLLAGEPGDAERLSIQFRQAARRVLPAVVTVRAEGASTPLSGVESRDPSGSGVIVDAAGGIILTNDHVVRNAQRVIVSFHDGRERTATAVRRDPRSDLAIVIVSAPGLTAARWGDSQSLDLGDWVLAIGQPFGLEGTVTAGIVSGKGRALGHSPYEDLIQTDAAINPGNSGGPLVNLAGEVVGINTAIKTQGGGYGGIGFAVPSARAKRIAGDLIRFGQVKRASIGVLIGRLDPRRAEQIGRRGAVPITGVAPLSPAAEADLRPGDVILAIGETEVQGVGMLQSFMESASLGEALSLKVFRDGKTLSIAVRPVAQAADAQPPAGPGPLQEALPTPNALGDDEPVRFPALGMNLGEPTVEMARRFGSDDRAKGLIVLGLEPGGPADRSGIEVGMLVTDVGGSRVESLDDLREALARRGPSRDVVLRVVSGRKAEFRVLLDLNPVESGRR